VEGDSTFAGDSVLEIEIGRPVQPGNVPHDILVQNGNITLGGTLDIRLLPGYEPYAESELAKTIVATRPFSNDFAVAGTDDTGEFIFLPTFTASPRGVVTGSFSNLDAEGRVQTSDGLGSFLVTITADAVTLRDFQSNAEPELTQELALSDDDGDGTPYVLEWLFGSDPDKSDTTKFLHANGAISGAELTALITDRTFEPTGMFMTLSFRVIKERGAVILSPQASEDLAFVGSPSVEAVSLGAVDDGPEFEIMTFALVATGDAAVPSKAFIRMDADVSGLPITPLIPILPPVSPPVVIPPVPLPAS